jgi:hypothetical protein
VSRIIYAVPDRGQRGCMDTFAIRVPLDNNNITR